MKVVGIVVKNGDLFMMPTTRHRCRSTRYKTL